MFEIVKKANDTLILGWGNPGRLDDGLGPAFADAIREMDLPGVQVETDYQLQVEDAAEVARHRRVVFVDADRSGAEPFRFERLWPSRSALSFSTHSVAPDAILGLTQSLFEAEPEAWLLGIRGYEFDDFGETLSDRARRNLLDAVHFVRQAVEDDGFRPIRSSETSTRTYPQDIGAS